MPRALIVAALAISALTALGERPAAHAQRKPLPVVRRSDKAPPTPFDRPPLIVLTRVMEQRTVPVDEGLTDGLGLSDRPVKLERQYLLSLTVMRVNERLPSDPDLGERYNFLLRQTPGDELTLEFGKNYILFVKFAKPIRGRPWRKSDPDPPPYFIAVPDAGFEIVGKKVDSWTVRVLRRGGVLAPYDGKSVDDVFRLITGQSFRDFEPK
jgi:hypothetical protein